MADFIQNIQGILITPSPALKASGLLKHANWVKGYAFGGWIFNSSLKLGFSKEPTELTLNIVLEASSDEIYNKSGAAFDIKPEILEKSLTANGGVDYLGEEKTGYYFTIDMHGLGLKRMFLYDYEISIEANQKTLAVTFKDYSLVLNKIYIGLIKRQGPAKGRTAGLPTFPLKNSDEIKLSMTGVEMEAYCPNCYLLGGEGLGPWGSKLSSFFNKEKGIVVRSLALGSFAVKYGDNVDEIKKGVADLSSLRYYDPKNPDIVTDKACYNSAIPWVDCLGLYPMPNPLINGIPFGAHWHPLRRLANAGLIGGWEPSNHHFCRGGDPDSGITGDQDLCEKDHCSGAVAGNSIDCANDGGTWYAAGTWENMRNLFPKEFWRDLRQRVNAGGPASRHPTGFTIDGGYLMLGTEEFTDKACSDLPNISYNFTELLYSLKFHGLSINTTTDVGSNGISRNVDKNPKFRQTYIGTLREVLEQWCGAFSLDFYWDNEAERISFVDLEQGADLSQIQDIADPTTVAGSEFAATDDGKTVIISYKESSSLANTHVQRVITSNVKPFEKREKSKDVQRYTPYLPMHPLDFTVPNTSMTNYHTVYGELFTEQRFANIIPWTSALRPYVHQDTGPRMWAEPAIPIWHEARKRIWYTQRQLWDIDYSIALSKFNRSLRDIYVGQRVVENCMSSRRGIIYDADGNVDGHGGGPWNAEISKDFEANCMALGFWPISEVVDPVIKTDVMTEFMQAGGDNDVQDINLDQRFYKIFIGYYTNEEHEDVVSWEQRCADSMYKHGAAIQGTLPGYPFFPREFYGFKDGEAGFDQLRGLTIPKLEHSFSPSAGAYAQCTTCLETFDAPFNGVLIRSGNFLPTGLLFADLDNPWGTNVEDFEIHFNEVFMDNACTKYNNSLNIREDMEDMYPYKTQSWDLDAFVPKFFDDLSEAWVALEEDFEDLYANGRLIDEISIAGVDINSKFRRTCKKMHVMIVADVTKHENIYFHPRSTNGFINKMSKLERMKWEVQEGFRKAKEEYFDRCDYDINFEFCEDAIAKQEGNTTIYGHTFGIDTTRSCAISPTGVYKEGFDRNLIGGFPVLHPVFGPFIHPGDVNSRALNIRLVRNPNRNVKYPPTDDLGFYYLADLEEDLDRLPTAVFDYNLVYPINNFKMYAPYGWYPGTEPMTQPIAFGMGVIQSPLFLGGLGSPVNPGNFQCYSGIWNAKISIEERRPELVEIYGEPISLNRNGNPTSSIKIINNTVDPDMESMIDPHNNAFITRIFDADGSELKTVEDYHDYVSRGAIAGARGLDDYSVIKPTKQITMKLAGSVNEFPKFKLLAHPRFGLTSYSVSLGADGLNSDLSFATRPPAPPEMESILNKIGPRIM
jgi:hypothetical protein